MCLVAFLLPEWVLLSSSRLVTFFVCSGKSVWGYHCVSPTPNNYLNSFVDVPLAKQRLIPWLAAQSNLTGWLYWYINYGWVHSDISSGEKAKVAPLALLDPAGHSTYDARVSNGAFWTNEDGNWMYPGQHGPLSSLRLEAWRRGLEDRALLALLTPAQRAELSGRLVRSASNWTIDPRLMEQTRADAAALVGKLAC
eukprot:COSAG04_NODE_459_length_14010_cov_5.397311_3_plen_196_part_00